MVELRAYALGVADLRGVVGATGVGADHLRTLVRPAFASQTRPVTVREALGPIHRRVPGAPVLRDEDPTPDDLDVLLSGRPVEPTRAAATWRLVEVVVTGLAWARTRVPDVGLPDGLLAPAGLALPPVDGLSVGWCPLADAEALPGLRGWLTGAPAWTEAAVRAGRPAPDVLVFCT